MKALLDMDASQCFAQNDIAEQVATIGRAPTRLKFETATGIAETEKINFVHVWLYGSPLFWTFFVVPNLIE